MSSSIGPYQPGDKIRIPLEITLNGAPVAVANPRVQRLVLPDGTNAPGFPASMTTLKVGTHIYETTSFSTIGNYTAILQADFGGSIIESIVAFVIEKPFGAPRIEIACD
jgi:hypothetical protein